MISPGSHEAGIQVALPQDALAAHGINRKAADR